jgi:hypothetical protein
MMSLIHRTFRTAVVLVLLASLSGCGYSLAGRGSFLPAYIKIIGVPTFVNNSPVFDVEQKITAAVRTELIGRGKYKVVTEATGVDGLLSGEIQAISIAPAAFTDQRTASRYVVTLTVKIEFKDVKADKVIWSNPSMQFREEYDVTNTSSALDPNAFFGQDLNALERLATEFARSAVSAILEAF